MQLTAPRAIAVAKNLGLPIGAPFVSSNQDHPATELGSSGSKELQKKRNHIPRTG